MMEKNGWQPIATAPKDGTPILAWPCWDHPDWAVATVEWLVDRVAGFRNYIRWEGWVYYGRQKTGREPTHWQPLPPPPDEPA